jgi:hypothetical protein
VIFQIDKGILNMLVEIGYNAEELIELLREGRQDEARYLHFHFRYLPAQIATVCYYLLFDNHIPLRKDDLEVEFQKAVVGLFLFLLRSTNY